MFNKLRNEVKHRYAKYTHKAYHLSHNAMHGIYFYAAAMEGHGMYSHAAGGLLILMIIGVFIHEAV